MLADALKYLGLVLLLMLGLMALVAWMLAYGHRCASSDNDGDE